MKKTGKERSFVTRPSLISSLRGDVDDWVEEDGHPVDDVRAHVDRRVAEAVVGLEERREDARIRFPKNKKNEC